MMHASLTHSRFATAVATLLILFSGAVSVAAPDAPGPLFPSAYITDTAPEFNWTMAPNAVSYEFALGDDTDTQIYFDQAGIANPLFAIAGAVFDQGKVYHWKVRAFDASGIPSAWSAIESFLIYDPALVPSALGPAGYITATAPLFQWSAIEGAANYDLLIQDENETSTINMIGSINGTSYQEPASIPFVPYVVYHYRVRTRMPDGRLSLWSNPGSFMAYSPSDTPKLLGPTIQAPLGQTNFSWMPLENAVSYELMVLDESETNQIIVEKNVKVNGYAPLASAGLEVGVVYHWKVRSNFASGAHSIWSETASFKFFDPSIVPDPLLPFGYITSTKPILEWSQVPGAESYELVVSDSLTQALLLSDSVTGDTRYDLASHLALAANHSYDWRVRAHMADGRSSVLSAPRAFRITADIWNGLITHQTTSAHYVPNQVIKFGWQPLSLDGVGVIRYHVVLRFEPGDATGGSFRTIWSGDATTGVAGLTLPSDVLFEPKSTYAWIVQAYSPANILIGTSRKVSFKTPGIPPAAFKDQIRALEALEDLESEKLKAAQAEAREDLLSEQAVQLANYAKAKKSAAAVASLLKAQALQLQALNTRQFRQTQALMAKHNSLIIKLYRLQDAALRRSS